MENNYICCFTGHREISSKDTRRIPHALKKILLEEYEKGARVFRAGGALGFDTLAALSVLELKKKHPDVVLELCLPCRDQSAKWTWYSKRIYEHILKHSDRVRYASEFYTSSCMHDRNRMLADGSKVCIAYYMGGGGGTAYTFNYAIRKGLEMINVFDILNK